MSKKNCTFTCEENVWKVAGILLGKQRSQFLENQLKEFINAKDDVDELKKEIEVDEKALFAKKKKLANMETIREQNTQNQEKMDTVMETVYRIVQVNGSISEEQIKFIATNNELILEELQKKIKREGIKITKYTADFNETSSKKYF